MMTMNKTLAFASLGLVPAAFSPVMATDAAAQTVYNWSGVYAGLNFGYNRHWTTVNGFSGSGADWCWADNCSSRSAGAVDGAVAGLQGGANFQFGNIVLGGEVDFGLSSAYENVRYGNDPYDYNVGLHALGTARLRAGYAFDRALVYATGGLAVGRVASDFAQIQPFYSWSNKTGWRVGYAVGGGVEYGMDAGWSIKGDGLFYSFPEKKKHLSDGTEFYGPGEVIGLEDRSRGMVLRIGFNKRF